MLEIRPISYKEAAEFVNRKHRHHKAPTGGKYSIACYRDGELVGVAMCGRPVSRFLDDGLTIEINRICTDGTPNACSKLYGAACRVARAMGYKVAVTYILQSENGASVKSAGFKCEGVAGGEHWTGSRDRGQQIPAELKTRWTKNL